MKKTPYEDLADWLDKVVGGLKIVSLSDSKESATIYEIREDDRFQSILNVLRNDSKFPAKFW